MTVPAFPRPQPLSQLDVASVAVRVVVQWLATVVAAPVPGGSRTAAQYVRRYWWAAYLAALGVSLGFGIVLWLLRPAGVSSSALLVAAIAPNLMASSILALLFLLSDWIKSGEDELGREALTNGLNATLASVEAVHKNVTDLRGAIQSHSLGEELSATGIAGAFAGRIIPNEHEYLNRFWSARKSVDMIGLDFSAVLRNFDYYNSGFQPGVRIRILMLDPVHPDPEQSYMTRRAHEERDHPPLISGARKFCHMFARWKSSLAPERLAGLDYSIRLYQTLPAIHYVRYDNEVLFGPYLIEKSSEHTFTLMSKAGTPIFEQLADHFEGLWSRWSREALSARSRSGTGFRRCPRRPGG